MVIFIYLGKRNEAMLILPALSFAIEGIYQMAMDKKKISEKQLIAFIDICTQAEMENKSLLDARYHFLYESLGRNFASRV